MGPRYLGLQAQILTPRTWPMGQNSVKLMVHNSEYFRTYLLIGP